MTSRPTARTPKRARLNGTAGLGGVLVVGAAAALVLLGAHTTPAGYEPRTRPLRHFTLGPLQSSPPPPAPSQGRALPASAPGGALLTVLLAALAILVLLAGWYLVRRIGSARLRHAGRRSRAVTRTAPPDLARTLQHAVQSGLDDLDRWPVRDAVILCWLRVHDAAVACGMQPHPADTPAEFVARTLSSSDARPEPLRELAELYREARFSVHAMSDADRDAARTALEAIRADLAAGVDVRA